MKRKEYTTQIGRAIKKQKTQAEMEEFVSEFTKNNPDATPEEAEKAFKADKKKKQRPRKPQEHC